MRRAMLAAFVSFAAACSGSSSPPATTRVPVAEKAAKPAVEAALPPLPVVQFAAARPMPVTRAAYEFAARHPEVLKHIPCFCGCERNGHGNNEDCFIARRNADNSLEWSPHGIGCGICIDVALAAKQMHDAGTPLVDIRRAIDQKYKSEFPTSTPTPAPHPH